MKHASPAALNRIDALLKEIRREKRLTERRTGIFYFKGQAVLHFHEDPVGIFADLKRGGDWIRYVVNDQTQQRRLLQSLVEALAETR